MNDLCRLHSLNAYFGEDKLSITQFYDYCKEYDGIIDGLKTKEMDGFSNGRCIINHILEQIDNVYLLLIPINSYNTIRNNIDIDYYTILIKKLDGYFEFNKGHIWYIKKIKDDWIKIDNLSGEHKINEPKIGKNGYLLVINDKHIYNEMNHYITILSSDCDNYIENNEVIFYNLHYALKYIKMTKTNDAIFNTKLSFLETIKELLNQFITKNDKDVNKNKDINEIKILANKFISTKPIQEQ